VIWIFSFASSKLRRASKLRYGIDFFIGYVQTEIIGKKVWLVHS